ncbi:MAG: NAD+ synthase [Treponema sp.]|jgi:NAD+ synthase (glutamine-hydrolysing)|nr:NAD+ synthase [Treponema sp.]HOI22955.1 NAD+ synthase [Spirochaetales bacterium]
MIVCLAQMDSVIGDFAGNAARIAAMTKAALAGPGTSAKSDLIVFPELSLCGYPPMDLLDQEAFVEGSLKALRFLQKELPQGLAVAVGYVDKNREASGRSLVNAMAVIVGGKIVFTQEKTLLPTYDVFDEARYFEPAKTRKVFVHPKGRIGFAICEDFWWESPPNPSFKYTVDPVKELLDLNPDLLIVPSASPFVKGKLETRLRLARSRAREGGIPVLYCNAVGSNDSLVFDGRSFVVTPKGKPLAFCGWGESFLVFDSQAMRTEGCAEGIPFGPEDGNTAAGGRAFSPGMGEKNSSIEELHRAIIVGIQGYMAKSGFTKACLGLSGGIDSAIVAALAAEALGPENVQCIAMPSRFSSEGSINDSVELCRRLGMALERLPIETPFKAYLDLLAGPFAGRPFDLAEENLQARIRGALLMAWSNKFNALLLTTGNKSELAAGYCTLYGDMCGALAPIGDLYKTEVYDLAKHLNALAGADGRAEPIPLSVIEKAPSAELRQDQKDQDSLPPYDVLDGMLRLYIEDNASLDTIAAAGFDRGLASKVLAMVARAEYKRRQAAPVIKLSRRAFGIGRRLPLTRQVHETRI